MQQQQKSFSLRDEMLPGTAQLLMGCQRVAAGRSSLAACLTFCRPLPPHVTLGSQAPQDARDGGRRC